MGLNFLAKNTLLKERIVRVCFWMPITEYGRRKEADPRCCFKSIADLEGGKALLYSGFKKKQTKRNQVNLERHDIPRVLETPFLFSSENTETKQI